MAIQKKSLISNRTATKKALVAKSEGSNKPSVTAVVPNRVAATPHRVAATPHRVAATPHRVAATPHRVKF
jgi:hypothetical protein